MNKKLFILGSISTLAVGGAFAAALAFKGNNSALTPARATDKSFTFDEDVGNDQFEGGSTVEEQSVVTGVGSNLETSVSLLDGSKEESKSFGKNGYFVRNGSTISHPVFSVEVGVNNLQSVNVVYGCVKTTYTVATAVYCYIDVCDADGNWHNDQSGSNGGVFNTDRSLGWDKSMSGDFVVKGVRVRVGADGSNFYWGEPLYIKSITLNWSC